MALTFTQADRLFRESRINELTETPEGIRFLKLRSMNRPPEYLERLFDVAGMGRPESGRRGLFQAAFDSNITTETVDTVIRGIHEEARNTRRGNEAALLNQLYRVQEFNWGGLEGNKLEQTIVDKYVKKIRDYDTLCHSIENELLVSMRGYVVCSWYNHWTSIIIEDIFKDHKSVLPAVGLVKQIDFFVNDVPFDLKVTYLPEGFIEDKRKEANSRENGMRRPEVTLLKRTARQFGLPINTTLGKKAMLQDLWEKVRVHPSAECRQLIADLRGFRDSIVESIEEDPEELIRWLYENQGDRRFDASNRLFLVLVDPSNYFDSWKLKRAKQLMEARIHERLSGYGERPGRQVDFSWEGKRYSAVSDVMVVKQPQ